jgi:hypothetical protein
MIARSSSSLAGLRPQQQVLVQLAIADFEELELGVERVLLPRADQVGDQR